jgi:SAM-dependent methyltransferase
VLTVEPALTGEAGRGRVLDLGCGGGRHAHAFFRQGAAVVALDRDLRELDAVVATGRAMHEAGEEAPGGRLGACAADALRLPFADATFDLVVAAEVFEHLSDDRASALELRRVLRPGGLVALSVPRFGPEWLNWRLSADYHQVEGGHVRIYTRRSLGALLASAGLRPVRRRYRHGLHSPYWWLRCAVGIDRDEHRLVAAYHRLLVWDIVARPRTTRLLDALLNPFIGKSLVWYLERAEP